MQQQVAEKQKQQPAQRKSEPSFLGRKPEHPFLQAQNVIGNHGLLRLSDGTPLQCKLEVSSPTDECELEADRIADEVMRMPELDVRSTQRAVESENNTATLRADPTGIRGARKQSTPESLSLTQGLVLRRSWLGGLVGGALGAAGGAALGFILGGPVGAIAGGLVGLVGGGVLGEKLTERRRALTSSEKSYAKEVFKDSVDYDKVEITRDSLYSVGAPKTIGNTIHLKSSWGHFEKDTMVLTREGKLTLIHEMGHVWQYQNGGLAYIPNSLWSQFKAWIQGEGRGGAYEWEEAHNAGLPWSQWNAEQQAQAIEEYNWLLRRSKAGDPTLKLRDFERLAKLTAYMSNVWKRQGAPGSSTRHAPAQIHPSAISRAPSGSTGVEVTPHVESLVQSLRGGGRPLSGPERAFFEPRFGQDFSLVRVHGDALAAEAARAVQARAFTVGQDVVLGSGQYAYGSEAGARLLGHELAHVVQQRSCIRCRPGGQAQPEIAMRQETGGQQTGSTGQENGDCYTYEGQYDKNLVWRMSFKKNQGKTEQLRRSGTVYDATICVSAKKKNEKKVGGQVDWESLKPQYSFDLTVTEIQGMPDDLQPGYATDEIGKPADIGGFNIHTAWENRKPCDGTSGKEDACASLKKELEKEGRLPLPEYVIARWTDDNTGMVHPFVVWMGIPGSTCEGLLTVGRVDICEWRSKVEDDPLVKLLSMGVLDWENKETNEDRKTAILALIKKPVVAVVGEGGLGCVDEGVVVPSDSKLDYEARAMFAATVETAESGGKKLPMANAFGSQTASSVSKEDARFWGRYKLDPPEELELGFDTNKTDIVSGIEKLDPVVAYLNAFKSVCVNVYGHCDRQGYGIVGQQEHNKQLSKDRADKVKDLLCKLVSKRVDPQDNEKEWDGSSVVWPFGFGWEMAEEFWLGSSKDNEKFPEKDARFRVVQLEYGGHKHLKAYDYDKAKKRCIQEKFK